MNPSDILTPVLSVVQPHADLLLTTNPNDSEYAIKTIEHRGINTTKRSRVAIYATNTVITDKRVLFDLNYMIEELKSSRDNANKISDEHAELMSYCLSNKSPIRGAIIGTVEIIDCLPHPLSPEYLENIVDHHLAPTSFLPEGKPVYGWILRNPKLFKTPVKIDKWPSGGPWARISKSKLPEVG